MLIIKLLRKTPKKNFYEKINEINSLNKCNDNDTPRLINYNASWCKHSKKMESVWYRLQDKLIDKNINLISINCEEEHNKGICYKEKIKYYPTIKLYIKNKVFEYTKSDTNINSLIEFIKEKVNQV